jgi:hypothetical protein
VIVNVPMFEDNARFHSIVLLADLVKEIGVSEPAELRG